MKTMTTKKDETPEFVEFWENIWRPKMRPTDGRGDARDTFFKHVRAGADPIDIIDGARFFIRTLRDFQYIPLAASWINKRAYEDLAEQERAYQRRISERAKPQEQSNVVSMQIDPEKRREMAARARELIRSVAQ